MKNIVLGMLVSCTIISLSSCDPWEDESYEEGTNPTEEVTIPGTWKLTAITLEDSFDFNGDGTATTDLMAETNCYQNELMAFNQDLSGVSTSNSYAHIIVNGTLYITECIDEVEETPFAWAQNQNTISLTIDSQIVNATLAGDILTFTLPDGFTATDGQPGGLVLTQDIKMTYKKIP